VDLQERRALILQLIESQGEVSVSDLSRRADVSEMTIRRDLEVLEGRGLLVRLHGRAIAPVSRSYEPPFDLRVGSASSAKQQIGALAAGLITEGETVILDVGTTTLEVARALSGRRNITVLTPSLPIANVLAEDPGIRVMVTGGVLRPGERSLVGDLAVASFREFRFDTVVLGVGGIDLAAGLTEYNLDDARVKRAALEIARRIVVVADATKLGRVAFARICPVEQVDILVTDRNAPADLVASLEDAGVEVRLA
jgi:DeoR/GlpR family transcriptional regulator of sugar metabolism